MQRLGFIHDMLDVKVLILFVMSRVSYPATSQQIYELCFQDDCVSYFDVCAAIPQMVKSGHLTETEEGLYEITEKGRVTDSGHYKQDQHLDIQHIMDKSQSLHLDSSLSGYYKLHTTSQCYYTG